MLATMNKALSFIFSKLFPGKAFIKKGSSFFVRIDAAFPLFFQWIIQLFTGQAPLSRYLSAQTERVRKRVSLFILFFKKTNAASQRAWVG